MTADSSEVGIPHISCLFGKLKRWILRNLASLKDIQVKTVLSLGPLGQNQVEEEGFVVLQVRYHTELLNLAPGLA